MRLRFLPLMQMPSGAKRKDPCVVINKTLATSILARRASMYLKAHQTAAANCEFFFAN